MPTPLISIGIIFKNDIRCIERCLKALQPLRDAVPAELVIADTGSTDGSREVAEKYADILIDFPWIDDFAAARNSVLKRCSGKWFMFVETDEYLDEDVSELVRFLRGSKKRPEMGATVVVRNYGNYELEGDYSDFAAARIVRMVPGLHFEGAIHEHLVISALEIPVLPLGKTILHHDGYVGMRLNDTVGKAKQERNVRLIRKGLEEEPDNLLLCMQLLESGSAEMVPDYLGHLRRTVGLVKEKVSGWERLGPPVLRFAVYKAQQLSLPELEEWLGLAEEMFPHSMFTRLDVQYAAFAHIWNTKKDAEEAIRRGRLYLQALEECRNGADPLAQMMSPLEMATPFSECKAKIALIGVCCNSGHEEEALDLARGLNYSLLNHSQIAGLMGHLQDIHFKSTLDTAAVVTGIWEEVNRPEEEHKNNIQRKRAFLQVAGGTFPDKNREAEKSNDNFVRHAYTLYLPLREQCDLGRAAAVMDMETAPEMEAVLNEVEDWNGFSIHALAHALECGARFPLPGKPLAIENMEGLARRLAQEKGNIFSLAARAADEDLSGWQALTWARGLVIAAVRVFDWKKPEGENAERPEEEKEQGVRLARIFAKIEGIFIGRYYKADILSDEAIYVLPPMHRFGWYCSQAFELLDGGDAQGYVRQLRAGLDLYRDVAEMVEFLLDYTPELQAPQPSAELSALAEQIRIILAGFGPNDPAVAALKQSEAYQKVAYLIEGLEPPVAGGLMQ